MAKGKGLSDHIGQGVRVLFVGINPGTRSAAVGHHFAGHSNRFWKLLCGAKLVPFPLTYEDDWRLPTWGFGITNIISRSSPGMDSLKPVEFEKGRARLLEKIRRHRPRVVVLLGVTLYPVLFPKTEATSNRKKAGHIKVSLGLQDETLAEAKIFVLPNPSGRNTHYSYAKMLAAYRALKICIEPLTRISHEQ